MSDEISLARGWTLEAYVAHNESIRAEHERFERERDRRYAEVSLEREKALKIKETADLAALGLAREIQTYKDEKANELREQIGRERGNYATKDDLVAAVSKLEVTIKPVTEYVSVSQGRRDGFGSSANVLYAILVLAVAIVTAAILYSGSHHATPASTITTETVTTPTVTVP